MTSDAANDRDRTLIAAIQQSQTELQTAMTEGDWERVAVVDEELKLCIQAAVEEVKGSDSRQILQKLLEEIQVFYRTLVEQGTEYRNRVAGELRQVRKGSSAANQYMKSSYNSR